jgi:hypothetical protein
LSRNCQCLRSKSSDQRTNRPALELPSLRLHLDGSVVRDEHVHGRATIRTIRREAAVAFDQHTRAALLASGEAAVSLPHPPIGPAHHVLDDDAVPIFAPAASRDHLSASRGEVDVCG